MLHCCRPQLKALGSLPMQRSYSMMLFSRELIKTEMGLFLVLDLLCDIFRLMCKFTASSKGTGKNGQQFCFERVAKGHVTLVMAKLRCLLLALQQSLHPSLFTYFQHCK